jgi:hypothetical protein
MLRINHFKTILVLLPVIIIFSCKKSYTKEEATDLLETDSNLEELAKLRAADQAALTARFKSIATPQVVKKYMQAKAKGDQQYLATVRNQILSTHKDNLKKEVKLYSELYRKYVVKLHIPKEEFRNIVHAAYKRTGKTR